MDEDERNMSTKVFTEEEEISLLNQTIKDRQSLCTCISCAMYDLKNLAYQVARKKKRPYPKSWNRNQQAKSEWLEKFEKRHSNKISKLFSHVCEAELVQASTGEQHSSSKEIFTFDEEEGLLIYVETTKQGCICRNCIMKEISYEAYKVILDMEKHYPKSWDIDKQAGRDWLKGFEERHKDKILKLSPVCDLPQVFTLEEEQLLLEEVQGIVEATLCTGEEDVSNGTEYITTCLLEELRFAAYERAVENTNPYPISWDKNECVDDIWLDGFVKRHYSELLKYCQEFAE